MVDRGPDTRQPRPWRWYGVIALTGAYILLPGPHRSPFSGLPLSSKATLLFAVLLIVAVFGMMFRPQRTPRAIWPAALLALVVGKLLLLPLLLVSGWQGVYRTAVQSSDGSFMRFTTAYFHTHGAAARPYRVDRQIAFEPTNVGLSFVNDVPHRVDDPYPSPKHARREVSQPLIVRWSGYVHASGGDPLTLTLSGAGRMAVDVDGTRHFDRRDPQQATMQVPLSAGAHRVDVTYVKRVGVAPRVHVSADRPVTTTPADPARLRRGALAETATTALGALALLLLAAAFVDAYRPLRRDLIVDLWSRPDKTAAVLLAAFFIVRAVYISVPARGETMSLGVGDDPLIYARDARWIARNGLLLRDDIGRATPYFFYPLYSYGAAAAHVVFGDDYSTIRLFNELCAAASVLLMWALLRNRIRRGALALILALVFAPFLVQNYGIYAKTAFSDNLFGPMVLAMLVVCVTAFERRSMRWLFLAGVFTALGAAARASLMTHIAFVCLAVVFYREFGNMPRRLRGCAIYLAGFAVGVAPFTIRNWVVSNKFVLLVSSIIQMPYFLFWGSNRPVPDLMIDGRAPTFTESLQQYVSIYMSDPLHFTWHQAKKVLSTLGWVEEFGPEGYTAPQYLVLFPILFALALWLRRVPRPMTLTLLAFCGSHMLAMLMASPWTYGYKTILPFLMATMAGGAFLFRNVPVVRRTRELVSAPVASITAIVHGPASAARLQEIRDASGADEVLVVGGDPSDEPLSAGYRRIAATSDGKNAALRRALREAAGDAIVVVPADPAYGAGDTRRLLPFASDYDLVVGSRQWDPRQPSMRLSRQFARVVGFVFRAPVPLTDIRCDLWAIRRDAAAALHDELRDSGDAFTLDLMVVASRAKLRVLQVPVTFRPADDEAAQSLAWFRGSVAAFVHRLREKRREDERLPAAPPLPER